MTFSRVASLVVAAGWLVVAFLTAGAGKAALTGLGLLLPVALIWFAGPLGEYVGPAHHPGYIDETTPGSFIITTMGWLILLGIPFFSLLVRL